MDNEEPRTLSPEPLMSDSSKLTVEKPLLQALEQATDEIASFQDHHSANSQEHIPLNKANSQALLPHVAKLSALLRSLGSFEDEPFSNHAELEDFPDLINLSKLEHSNHQPDFSEMDKTITRASLFTCAVCFGNSLSAAVTSLSGNMTLASATYTAGWVALTSFWARSAIKMMKNKPQKTRLLSKAAKKSSVFTTIALGAHVALSHMFPNVVPPVRFSHSVVQVLCTCFWHFIYAVNKEKQAAVGSVEKINLDEQSTIKSSLQAYDDNRSTFLTTLANEIEDATVMLISTLHYFSPSRILEGSHELLTACSIPVPIASISAINTTTKQVRYISSNLPLLARMSLAQNIVEDTIERSTVQKEFDIGEMLQAVGDAMAGVAAKLDVKLVIYHSDNALHYTNVQGDEDVLRHTLINLVRNLLDSCTTGSCIELGLNVTPISSDNENEAPRLLVTFSMTLELSSNSESSLLPNANLTSKLLYYLGGSLALENIGETNTSFIIRLEMNQGTRTEKVRDVRERPHERLHRQLSNIRFSDEPTLDELSIFVNRLSGVKVVLYAPNQSIFAKHLTSCLAGWNVNISHVSVARPNDDDTYFRATDSEVTTPGSEVSAAQGSVGTNAELPTRPDVTSPQAEQTLLTAPAMFVLIDDDVYTLEQQLHEFRAQAALIANAHSSRRHKRGKSAAQANHTTAIIHFTALSEYKKVRDTINWFHTVSVLNPQGIPQVIVVPKPAGPRRFLTALHTAWSNAVVEPQYLPIATSPSSPMTPSSQKSIWNGGFPGSLPSPSHTSGVDDSGSSNESSTHAARRPTSAIYSPPIVPIPNDEGSNYFTAPGSSKVTSPSGIHAHEVQGSPTGVSTVEGVLFDPSNKSASLSVGSTPSARSSLNRYRSGSTSASAHATRRRSNTDLRGNLDGTSHISLPTGFHHPPMDQVSPGGSPLKQSTTASQGSPLDTPSPHTTTAKISHAVDPAFIPPEKNVIPATPSPSNVVVTEQNPMDAPAVAAIPPVIKPISEKSSAVSRRRRKEKVASSGVSSPPINVLIVEDNVINQAILSTWMKKHKIKFGTASNGQEALDKWNGGGYHLILMDIQLPVMDGIEATQRIRAIEKEQKTGKLTRPAVTDSQEGVSVFRSPVIIVALTASSLASDREAALSAGCNDFLTKPVDLVWLEKKIIEWGCMQALIDFDSWRKWKRSEATTTQKPSAPPPPPKTAEEPATATTTTSKPASPQPSRSSDTMATRKGVLLPGASGIKRRGSNVQDIKSGLPPRRTLTRASSDPQIQTSTPPKSNVSANTDTRTGSLSPIKESSGSSTDSTVKMMSEIAVNEALNAGSNQSNQQEKL
ncbi:hypothetical protein INT43_001475 [Umbelopsis isabellina]|uniref:Response regulatory domain-containing protein n=1 Tax=Mortierella isabellina TaxID=91625 RepID=A0A8H7U9R5_MORIS|nr:hypothetical protein INT43_001475 [Umbelopsis isabellina]